MYLRGNLTAVNVLEYKIINANGQCLKTRLNSCGIIVGC